MDATSDVLSCQNDSEGRNLIYVANDRMVEGAD